MNYTCLAIDWWLCRFDLCRLCINSTGHVQVMAVECSLRNRESWQYFNNTDLPTEYMVAELKTIPITESKTKKGIYISLARQHVQIPYNIYIQKVPPQSTAEIDNNARPRPQTKPLISNSSPDHLIPILIPNRLHWRWRLGMRNDHGGGFRWRLRGGGPRCGCGLLILV